MAGRDKTFWVSQAILFDILLGREYNRFRTQSDELSAFL